MGTSLETMTKMQLYRLAGLLLVIQLVDAAFYIRKDRISNCDYRGYIPGGKVTSVGKIKAPVATLAKNGIAAVLGPASQASTLAMHSLNTAKAVLGVFEKVAPTLGPVLGVFGAATGIFKSLTEVKPKDILDAANTAMGTLTKDINDKIERMQGYVDSRVITLEKNLIQREYQVAFNLWTGCAQEATVELSNECQREAFATLSANRPKFAVFAQKLGSNAPLTGFEARELEAYLVPFRDYAYLILMMLKPLVKTYATDHSSAGRHHLRRYEETLKSQTEFFIKYSTQAVKAILDAHNGKGGNGVCQQSVDCGPLKKIKEGGWFKVWTASSAKCTCVIEDGTKQLCTVDMTFRKDGKIVRGYLRYDYRNCRNDDQAAREFTGRVLVPEAVKYQKLNQEIASAYWQKELLDFIPVWKKAEELINGPGRRRDPARTDDEPEDEQLDELMEFSERYAQRLKAAKAKAMKILD